MLPATRQDDSRSWATEFREPAAARRLEGDYGGRLSPDLDLTSPMSEALITPSAVTSSRKLVASTGMPACALTCAMSEAFTVLFPVVSPMSMSALTGVSDRI